MKTKPLVFTLVKSKSLVFTLVKTKSLPVVFTLVKTTKFSPFGENSPFTGMAVPHALQNVTLVFENNG